MRLVNAVRDAINRAVTLHIAHMDQALGTHLKEFLHNYEVNIKVWFKEKMTEK